MLQSVRCQMGWNYKRCTLVNRNNAIDFVSLAIFVPPCTKSEIYDNKDVFPHFWPQRE